MRYTLSLFRAYMSQAAKAAIIMPPYIQEVITGMLWGDSCISKPTSTGKSQLMFEQANLLFIQLLWNIFNSIGITGAAPSTRSRFDQRTGNTYTSHRFNSFTLPILAVLYYKWYTFVEGKSIKHLPTNIHSLLTPVAIAFWVAGDGHYNISQGTVVIATDSFTLTEVELLQSILLEKYGIKSTINSNGSGKEQYRIRISKKSMPILQALVAPHIPEMMSYRIGL
jgi:hypothetical protein